MNCPCPISCQVCGAILTIFLMTVGNEFAGRIGFWLGGFAGIALTGVLWRLFWWDDPAYQE
jgi:hypothetical protein